MENNKKNYLFEVETPLKNRNYKIKTNNNDEYYEMVLENYKKLIDNLSSSNYKLQKNQTSIAHLKNQYEYLYNIIENSKITNNVSVINNALKKTNLNEMLLRFNSYSRRTILTNIEILNRTMDNINHIISLDKNLDIKIPYNAHGMTSALQTFADFLNSKKVDMNTYYEIKNYNVNKLLNDNNTKDLRNLVDHSEGITDREFYDSMLNRYYARMEKATFSKNLKEYCDNHNLTPMDVSKLVELPLSTIYDWFNGVSKPPKSRLTTLAEKIGTTVEQLESNNLEPVVISANDMTDDDNKHRFELITKDEILHKHLEKTVKVPVLGQIPAEIPNEAIEYIDDWEEIPASWTNSDKEFFALKIHGDSMSPTYLDGDIVIFQRASNCPSGKNCAVMIDNRDVTFKKFIQTEAGIILQPLNENDYDPTFYSKKQVMQLNIKIIGIPKELRRQTDL